MRIQSLDPDLASALAAALALLAAAVADVVVSARGRRGGRADPNACY